MKQTDPKKQMTNKGIKRLRDRNEKQLVMQKKEKNIENKVDEVPNRVQTHIQSRGR